MGKKVKKKDYVEFDPTFKKTIGKKFVKYA